MLAGWPYSGMIILDVFPWWFFKGIFNSCARVLTIVAPIRRPVKEPGPDIKVISVMSLKSA